MLLLVLHNKYEISKVELERVWCRRENNPTGMSAQSHPLVINEQQGNPHTTGQAAACPKTLLYTGTVKELPLYI